LSLVESLRSSPGFIASGFAELADKAKSLLAFRAQAVIYSGIVRSSSHGLTLLYVGNRTNLPFILQALFAEHRKTGEAGACNIWQAAALADAHAADVDCAVFDVPWPYEVNFMPEHRVIEMPSWVRQGVDLASTWDEVLKGLHRSARGEQMRKIRRNGLTAVTTTDSAAILSFYETMYVPHTRRRFGPAASIDSRADVLKSARNGALLQIRREDEVIAASVLHKVGNTLKSLYTGFASPDLRTLDGATAALHYHSLLYAFENGFRSLDYGGSRPLLNDGVYETKRRWGAAVYDDWSLESLLFRLERFTPGVEAFLCDAPLLTRQDGKLIGKLMIREAPLSAAGLRVAIQRCVSRGMDGLSVHALHGAHDDAARAAADSPIPVAIHDLRSSGDPLRTYCDA
jgi:hypothetical protein